MRYRIPALIVGARFAGAPPVLDASSQQRHVAASAHGVAMSASAIAQDLTGRLGRVYHGATAPAQVLPAPGFLSGVESDIGVGTQSSWPRLPKRRVQWPVP